MALLIFPDVSILAFLALVCGQSNLDMTSPASMSVLTRLHLSMPNLWRMVSMY